MVHTGNAAVGDRYLDISEHSPESHRASDQRDHLTLRRIRAHRDGNRCAQGNIQIRFITVECRHAGRISHNHNDQGKHVPNAYKYVYIFVRGGVTVREHDFTISDV